MPQGVEIKPRRMKFAYGDSTGYWASDDPVLTRFMEALSMLFPEGERFFVESVLRYKDQIVDPVLQKQVTAFVAQEGMHAAEHHKYNVRAAGPALAERFESIAGHLRHPGARRILSPINRLAVTVALEHFTAIMADELLRNPAYTSLMDPEHAKLWLWHAAEETEHKAVAFDVYQAVGGGYLRRAIVMQVTTFLFVLASIRLLVGLLVKDREEGRPRRKSSFFRLAFISPGFFRKVFPAWLDYFRPGFHPWQRDNSDLIVSWKERYAGG
jgi:predicted metal-dependent hydrolase